MWIKHRKYLIKSQFVLGGKRDGDEAERGTLSEKNNRCGGNLWGHGGETAVACLVTASPARDQRHTKNLW